LYNTLVQIGSISEQLPRSFFEELLAHTSRSKPRSLGRCEVSLFVVGGNARANDASARTCVDRISRESRYFAIVDAEWHATAGDLGREDAKAWAKASVKILMKYSTQHTLHAPDAVGALLSEVEEAKLEDSLLRRLKGIKAKYDPDNIFCQNMNIKPLVTLN
jgi:FAD/FMN-containing dehydrogenase